MSKEVYRKEVFIKTNGAGHREETTVELVNTRDGFDFFVVNRGLKNEMLITEREGTVTFSDVKDIFDGTISDYHRQFSGMGL